MSATVIRGDARALPLPDSSVDLVVTSPPYFALRSYTDGGEHYAGQIGSEATPAEYIAALIACTREWVRVLKPSGSIWVNLGDKYVADNRGSGSDHKRGEAKFAPAGRMGYVGEGIMPRKSLMMLPERYRIACVDELGLIARAVVIWSKPNGLPESVTDRVRRSHEDWVHLTKAPRYFSAVDEIREAVTLRPGMVSWADRKAGKGRSYSPDNGHNAGGAGMSPNPLGKLPGSVWEVEEGESFVRIILRAAQAGEITVEEGERLWMNAHADGSWLTSSGRMGAGSGRAGRTPAATAKPASSEKAARTGHTGTLTGSLSDPFRTDSPSTTSAVTLPASDPTTSSPSAALRTSAEHGQSGQSALLVIPSLTPTSSGLDTDRCGDAAEPATWGASEHVATVWTVPTEPLQVPSELGVDHFAAFPTEFPRRIILGWSPSGICVECGEGRRPLVDRPGVTGHDNNPDGATRRRSTILGGSKEWAQRIANPDRIIGEACACPEPTAPTRPAVVLDPFGGTGTTALVADALGRHGISVDKSGDYCRLAQWRTTDPAQRAKALGVPKPPVQFDGQGDLLAGLDAAS